MGSKLDSDISKVIIYWMVLNPKVLLGIIKLFEYVHLKIKVFLNSKTHNIKFQNLHNTNENKAEHAVQYYAAGEEGLGA